MASGGMGIRTSIANKNKLTWEQILEEYDGG